MAKFKYNLKESKFNVGQVDVKKGVKSTVTDIDPNTGAVSWDIDYVPNIDKLVEDVDELTKTAKGVYQKAKDDKKFLDIYEQSRSLRNSIRTHVRNNYPEEYKKAMNEEEVEEMSTSGGAGAYLTPYAFKLPKKKKVKEDAVKSANIHKQGQHPGEDLGPGPKATEDGVKDNAYVKQFKYSLVPKNKNGTYVQKGSGLEVKKLF
jgi:hypothetical protein|tara:strand:- start:1316 stop:1927 length:612 start_codon:yes stop_codon:yes gene_type:complete